MKMATSKPTTWFYGEVQTINKLRPAEGMVGLTWPQHFREHQQRMINVLGLDLFVHFFVAFALDKEKLLGDLAILIQPTPRRFTSCI